MNKEKEQTASPWMKMEDPATDIAECMDDHPLKYIEWKIEIDGKILEVWHGDPYKNERAAMLTYKVPTHYRVWGVPDDKPLFRKFDSGASRDTDEGKLDYEGFICPLVMKNFAQYMNGKRTMADGSVRDSDNWQKGIPKDQLVKSAVRHFEDLKLHHRDGT